MTTVQLCPICGNDKFLLFTTCNDFTVSNETFKIVQCSTCKFVLTNPRPSNEKLGDYYISENYISHANKASSLLDRVYLLARRFTLQWKVNLIHKYQKKTTELSILDYGCGTGEFLQACKQDGFIVNGVEPSESARKKASRTAGIKVSENLEVLNSDTFDVITLWHVLEHIPDFEKVIQQLKARLSNNGIMLIAVPNHLSYDAQQYKNNWAGFDVPRHLWHFSIETIKLFIHKNELSLIDIRGMKLDSFYVGLLSEKYRTGNRLTLLGYIKAFYTGLVSNFKAKKSREYSSLIYIIKK